MGEVILRLAAVAVMVAAFVLYYRWVWWANFGKPLTRKDIEDFFIMFVGGKNGRK